MLHANLWYSRCKQTNMEAFVKEDIPKDMHVKAPLELLQVVSVSYEIRLWLVNTVVMHCTAVK